MACQPCTVRHRHLVVLTNLTSLLYDFCSVFILPLSRRQRMSVAPGNACLVTAQFLHCDSVEVDSSCNATAELAELSI